MRRDKIICAQKYPVEWLPDGSITTLPTSYHLGSYLCYPHMKDTINPLLATVSARIIRQYIGHISVIDSYSA